MKTLTTPELIKIQPRGVITIPKAFREKLGFKENEIVRIIGEKGRLVIEIVRTLPYRVRSYSKEEVDEFIKLDKAEESDLKKKGLLGGK